MLVFGTICALAVGCSFPINLIIFTQVINLLTAPGDVDLGKMREMVGWFCLLGGVTLIVAFIELFFFSLSARRQSRRIRLRLFKARSHKVYISSFKIFHATNSEYPLYFSKFFAKTFHGLIDKLLGISLQNSLQTLTQLSLALASV